ncbi:MAG: glycogen/starch synthase [Muribaculaceae bacterium]|nr:glycogen/starch synthase [Muribaculaceae bacterium]
MIMFDYLFETSWEVCNRVGGIYTVLSTKSQTLQKLYKDRVFFIGPDLWTADNESPFFQCSMPVAQGASDKKKGVKTPLDDWAAQVVMPFGLAVRVGRWNVPGQPIAVLVDFNPLYEHKNELYAEMWDRFGVDSLHAYGDYDEGCAFAWAAALVIESIVAWLGERAGRLVAHFDEWTTGMGLLYVKSHLPQVATVFTTHATSIGRSICGNGKPLYDYMTGYNGDQMSWELNMVSKHSLEKAAAHAADAFTTVSEVTARECEQLLERRPLVTPNGFEGSFVPKGKAYDAKRQAARERLMAVARALSGVDYAPDTLLVATSGRLEVRNKGIDAYLDALNVTRTALEKRGSRRRVLAFVLVPSWTAGPRPDLRRALATRMTTGLPVAQYTHDLHPGFDDPILAKMRALGFDNNPNDPLHVVYVPCYLNGNDGVIDLPYYDVLCGLDLTLFPSYYEPWGYTPLESVAFGVPTVTTTLSGFGQWVLHAIGSKPADSGVSVIHRSDSNYHNTVHALAVRITEFLEQDDQRLATLQRKARATAAKASWKHFINHYLEAYRQTLEEK